jgi:GT2 family glycosyltransferase
MSAHMLACVQPRLSVVVPTYRRADALARTLDALERQTTGADAFEVVVVVDAQDDAPERVDALLGSRPFRVRRLTGHGPGASAARNTGWRAAEAALVLFIGNDILAAPELIEQHLAWHERYPEDTAGVLGHVRWARELRRTAFMVWLDHGIQFNYPTIAGIEAGPGHFYTSNVSLKRVMLERSGGFDEQRFPFLYEDIDLGMRLFALGFRLYYNERARAEHLHEPRLDDWRRRIAAIAHAERQWIARHPEERPYFHDRFADALARPPARGRRGRLLLPWVPRRTPLLGRRVWENADLYFRQQLGRAFMDAWAEQ